MRPRGQTPRMPGAEDDEGVISQSASMRPRGQTPRMHRRQAWHRWAICSRFNEAAGADPADATHPLEFYSFVAELQ